MVELRNVVNNADVPTLAGINTELQVRHAAGGAQAVLPDVQAAFIRAVDEGIFFVPPKAGGQPAHVQPRFPDLERTAGLGAVAGLGAAASIYDAKLTAQRVSTLLAQDNPRRRVRNCSIMPRAARAAGLAAC